MTTRGMESLDTSLQKTNVWLRDIMERMRTDDRHKAWLALTTVLHAVRDRLPLEEVAQLAAQLPLVVRGAYFAGWQPGMKARRRHLEDLYDEVRKVFRDEPADAAAIVGAVFSVIATRISAGEAEDIARVLPHEVAQVWRAAAAAETPAGATP